MNQKKDYTKLNKKIFRQECKESLQKAAKNAKIQKNHKIIKHLEKLLKIVKPRNILIYIPLKNEPDITPFISKYRKKYNFFVPFMEGVSFKIVKYRLPLRPKKFGIKEPPNSFVKKTKIDLAIVPVVGVDGDYRRIGFGKGMYDRFFSSLSYRPIIAFVQLKKCFTQKHICDRHDIKADYYITPENFIKIKR